jgi:hypothetical protein
MEKKGKSWRDLKQSWCDFNAYSRLIKGDLQNRIRVTNLREKKMARSDPETRKQAFHPWKQG